MERKGFTFEISSLDVEGRMLEGYASAFGNVDDAGDIVHRGAFAKTLTERGTKLRLLWQHEKAEILGPVVAAKEDARGLWIKCKISKTQRGDEAIELAKDGAIGELSIGYDPMVFDYSMVENKTVRNLRELKLYEVSLVTFAANPEAVVTAIKEKPASDKATEPSESKPWRAIQQGDEWCVFKLGADGEPTGDTLGCHPSQDAANAQLAALYANEPGAKGGAEGGAEVKTVPMAVNSLSGRVETVRMAFDKQFNASSPDKPMDWDTYLSVVDVFDGYLVAAKGAEAYQIPYTYASGAVAFVPREEWAVGAYQFVPGAKAAGLDILTKAGRILAKRNASRIKGALDQILEVLKDAGVLDENGNPIEDQPTSRAKQTPYEPIATKHLELETLLASVDLEIAEAK